MKSTIGKVSAIMILLAFILASTLVLNIAIAQNETHALENITIEAADNRTTSWDFVEEILLNDAVDIVINETSYETSSEANETEPLVNCTNETNIADNETQENEILEPSETVETNFVVRMNYPQKITRGENILISAELASDSFAKNVYLKWILPQGMEIVSGNEIETCGDLNNSFCYSEISVRTEMSVLGLSKIRVVVSYEK